MFFPSPAVEYAPVISFREGVPIVFDLNGKLESEFEQFGTPLGAPREFDQFIGRRRSLPAGTSQLRPCHTLTHRLNESAEVIGPVVMLGQRNPVFKWLQCS